MGPPRVVVVGGGVSGLVAAYALAPSNEVLLLEADPLLGGKLQTGELLGRPLDLGPDSFITRDPSALRLSQEVGLGEELLAPAGAGAAVFARGSLRALPEGLALGVPTDLGALWRSGIVSRRAVLRAGTDLLLPGRSAPADLAERAERGGPDPTVAEVVGRRLGSAVLDGLVDPLLGGINASDVRALSFLAAAPTLAARAAGRRSLLRALAPPGSPSAGPAGGGGAAPLPLFLGLGGGMARLAEAVAAAGRARGAELRTGRPVRELRAPSRPGGPWRVGTDQGEEEADGLVLAVPAFVAASLLGGVGPELAAECAAIPYASVATLTFAWPEEAVPERTALALRALAGRGGHRGGASPEAAATGRLPGNGVLVPRAGGGLVTAATFTSTKWPRSAAPGHAVVRASVGRHGDDRALGDEEELRARVLGELGTLLGIDAAPQAEVLRRWPRSFPQYVSGHRARAARIAGLAARLPAIALVGAAYEGIGIPACVASGERGAALVAARIAGRARSGA